MAAGKDGRDCEALLSEFQKWQEATPTEEIFLLEHELTDDGGARLTLLLGGQHEFTLLCPPGYPNHEEHFFTEADPVIKLWGNTLNEYLLDSPEKLSLTQVLNKAASLYTSDKNKVVDNSEDEMSVDEEEDNEGMILSDDDSAFTTEWELMVARRKKRWAQKEKEVREELTKAKLVPGVTDLGAIQASGQEKEQARQIFTSSAASGILTNDLVKIMEWQQEVGFTADPINDNIYQWCVKLFNFDEDSELANDLAEIESRFGYNYIELEMDFAIDLYPFYPPLVKVIRPRLHGSMMQRVTNMEMLKLSYWNPAKDMKSVLEDIKGFLQQWARLESQSERNDMKRYPSGSYVDIEHHLLRLALVSEVNPRANIKYHLDVERAPEVKRPSSTVKQEKGDKQREEYWAAGTGYGHSKRPEWDIKAYLAAQEEKDKQIESVLHKILHELKVLYAQHAPQLKPRTVSKAGTSTVTTAQSVDPVEDMFTILEGSALVPFMEQYMKADSFLEICRHTAVYKVIVDIIKEIAMQPRLVPLLCQLADQQMSLHQLLQALERKASMLLQHVCKAGNGSIPKPPKKETPRKGKDKGCVDPEGLVTSTTCSAAAMAHSSSAGENAEERLARELVVLFKDVTEAINRRGLDAKKNSSPQESMDISYTDQVAALEEKYRLILRDLQFDSHDIELEGPAAHHYASEFKKQPTPNQNQVFRIAQEITSLSTSLPLNLSSSIFLRTDDEKLMLMRALITGPEGTPYSGGCFQFDIYFPSNYPKVPPMVNLQTTGGGTVRFNPNLYNCGKVCLSLLGTWEGQQGEQWNETTSTVLQVLVSIQSLILVVEPYFNEPGYEQEIGTEAGKRHSAEYNSDVKINNIKYAMISQLQNPSPGFEEVIKSHFYLKKERLIQEVDGWVKTSKSSKLERAVHNLKQELNKLQPSPNITNLMSENKARSSPQPASDTSSSQSSAAAM